MITPNLWVTASAHRPLAAAKQSGGHSLLFVRCVDDAVLEGRVNRSAAAAHDVEVLARGKNLRRSRQSCIGPPSAWLLCTLLENLANMVGSCSSRTV
jgi:hypothetical protein